MKDKITILVKEVPEHNHLLVKDTYIKQPSNTAYRLIDEGYAVGYNPNSKEEVWPFLSEDYPNRNILFDNDIHTENELKRRLGFVAELNGIGDKSIQTYKELLGLVEVEEAEKETVASGSSE